MGVLDWTIRGGEKFTTPNSNTGTVYTIPTVADNIRPSNAVYLARWGNDTTGNGSRMYPFKTTQKAKDTLSANNIIIIDKNYIIQEENWDIGSINAMFDGMGLVDATGKTYAISSHSAHLHNAIVKNAIYFSALMRFSLTNVVIQNVSKITTDINGSSGYIPIFKFVIFDNIYGTDNIMCIPGAVVGSTNITIINNLDIKFKSVQPYYNITRKWQKCIIKNSNITFIDTFEFADTVFHNCNFRFGTTNTTNPTTLPNNGTTVPTGFEHITDINILRTRYEAAFGTTNSFPNCIIADPKFNNEAAKDYTLAFDSPAKNLGYDGLFAGARGVAKSQAATTQIYTNNIQVVGGKASLVNDTIPGTVRFPIVDLGKVSEIRRINFNGGHAARNGIYVDSVKDLAAVETLPGETLTVGSYYVVEQGPVTYNSVVYPIGSTLLSVSGGTNSVSTTGGGVVRKIENNPMRTAVKIKFSDTLGTTAHFDSLTWHHYNLDEKPTANRQGDVGTGIILRGNGDPAFDQTPAKVFPVFARYYQIEADIKPGNLKA
jgi:hypothetical protein